MKKIVSSVDKVAKRLPYRQFSTLRIYRNSFNKYFVNYVIRKWLLELEISKT